MHRLQSDLNLFNFQLFDDWQMKLTTAKAETKSNAFNIDAQVRLTLFISV